MSNFLNKILGKDEAESHSNVTIKTQAGGAEKTVDKRSDSGAQNQSQKQTQDSRTVQRDGVNITSTVSSDVTSTVSMANQSKLNDLVQRLGTTHNQIDEYAKKQSAKINEEIEKEIKEVLARARREQEQLLHQANEHTQALDKEYRQRLQKMVEEIDSDKASKIAEIEKELNDQQAGILQTARFEIDRLNEKAANLKIGAIQQAQAKASEEASLITSQATQLSEASTRHHQSGTTTIKTDVTGGTTVKDTHTATTAAVVTGTKTSSETKTAEAASAQQTTAIKK